MNIRGNGKGNGRKYLAVIEKYMRTQVELKLFLQKVLLGQIKKKKKDAFFYFIMVILFCYFFLMVIMFCYFVYNDYLNLLFKHLM